MDAEESLKRTIHVISPSPPCPGARGWRSGACTRPRGGWRPHRPAGRGGWRPHRPAGRGGAAHRPSPPPLRHGGCRLDGRGGRRSAGAGRRRDAGRALRLARRARAGGRGARGCGSERSCAGRAAAPPCRGLPPDLVGQRRCSRAMRWALRRRSRPREKSTTTQARGLRTPGRQPVRVPAQQMTTHQTRQGQPARRPIGSAEARHRRRRRSSLKMAAQGQRSQMSATRRLRLLRRQRGRWVQPEAPAPAAWLPWQRPCRRLSPRQHHTRMMRLPRPWPAAQRSAQLSSPPAGRWGCLQG